ALLVTVFGVRTVIHQRRMGETAWRAPPNRAARVGDGLFTIGVLAATAGPALDLADVVEPATAFDRFSVHVVGVALLSVGGALAVLAQVHMGESWRAGIDVSGSYELVCHGLFRVVRNPFYLGIILAVAGVVLMVPSVVTPLGWIAVVLGCEIDVRLVEEPHLSKALGPRYREYAAVTGRFLPGLGRGSRSSTWRGRRRG
ncbi:MAG: methyltransferase family protein, partial [Acidimicrobiia bacterium]